MKTGILGLLVIKTVGVIGTLILVFALMVAVVGPKPAATLAGTTAVVTGQSTGIVFGTLPEFFRNITKGQSLVKPSTPDCTQLVGCDEKAPAKADPKKKN